PTGETNTLQLSGRGVFVCISPWNFPLAIFLGQAGAALAAGNSVIAKPAEQTNLVGFHAVQLMHEAGIPKDVLQFVPGDGATVGAKLTSDVRIAGVAFTGSTDTARAINRALAARDAAIGVLIAETGGQNALIGDSSALPEQLVKDVIASAFTSAGQRCSAARVLFVQEDIADKVLTMLSGAMAELKVGDPGLLSTDVGPVIDADALAMLQEHAERMDREARTIHVAAMDDSTAHGSFFAPRAYEIASLDVPHKEIFGPVLHVLRWKAGTLDAVIDAINATGYGLTLGVHSRIDATIEKIASRVKVGNCYVNRNQIGAVVGVQPFGGQNLSGTGPKAGGPHYLPRFATEKTITINTTAAGGNASLLTLGEERAGALQGRCAGGRPAMAIAGCRSGSAAGPQLVRQRGEFVATGHHPRQLLQRNLLPRLVQYDATKLQDDEMVGHHAGVVGVVGNEHDAEPRVAG